MSDKRRRKIYEITREGRIHIYPSLDEAKPLNLLKRLIAALRAGLTHPRHRR